MVSEKQGMVEMKTFHVWLAYVAYPVTTAVYFERALRQHVRTTTIGPRLPAELIERWQLQNMKLPLYDLNIPTSSTPDMEQLISATDQADYPDLYLWVESVGGHYPLNLQALPCQKACYLVDSHLNLPMHLEWAQQFDHVFIAQKEYLNDFRQRGIKAHWLPLGCDPVIHCRTNDQKSYPVGFVGSIQPGTRREALLTKLNNQIPVHYERCFWDEMTRLFCRSKIVFNEAVRNDLNMRVFEVMSTGTMLLTDLARNSGQELLFRDGEDYAVYRDSTIADTARFYLENESLREQIAARGQLLVHNAHTYSHRIDDLLAVSLKGKPDTWSAEELREKSLVGVANLDARVHQAVCISSRSRSFIIPVLDMSPASEYNICTLLDDLRTIEGDVIVIFNGQEIAAQLKDHPRINQYAVMKQNIGVARAWNLGLEIAATPTVFILNADLHIGASAVKTLETALLTLPDAACVGPQGSFSNFTITSDYIYFDKGSFQSPISVDAVSGFFFALKLEHFTDKIIRFENGFTPCYFEELDLGLQIKNAGLKNYIIPTTDYDHHWSGTIRALREIGFYEKAETANEILLRNRQLFLNKWRGITTRENSPQLLTSGFSAYVMHQAHSLITSGHFSEARDWLIHTMPRMPESPEISSLFRFVEMQLRKQDLAPR